MGNDEGSTDLVPCLLPDLVQSAGDLRNFRVNASRTLRTGFWDTSYLTQYSSLEPWSTRDHGHSDVGSTAVSAEAAAADKPSFAPNAEMVPTTSPAGAADRVPILRALDRAPSPDSDLGSRTDDKAGNGRHRWDRPHGFPMGVPYVALLSW